MNSTGHILENWLRTLTGNQMNHADGLTDTTVCGWRKKLDISGVNTNV